MLKGLSLLENPDLPIGRGWRGRRWVSGVLGGKLVPGSENSPLTPTLSGERDGVGPFQTVNVLPDREELRMTRTAHIQRKTTETQIEVRVNLDGQGRVQVQTGVGFFDHMLMLLGRHAAWDLTVQAKGDLEVDQHHTVEDVGIGLGQALRDALGTKEGITRYGHCILPMEETLVTAAVDLGGRPYFLLQAEFPSPKIGEFDSELVHDFWHAVATHGLCNLHVLVHYGRNSHHIAEGIFKAVARALRMAVGPDPLLPGLPSTKGVL